MADLLMKMPIPYEPKRTNRFIFRFRDELGINEWTVKGGGRPKLTINSNPIEFLNTEVYVAGSFKWEGISVTLRDPIGPSSTQAVMEWARLCAESVTGRMGYAAGYKKNVDLELLDPTGVVVEKWQLVGCFITSVSHNELSYGQGNLVEITLQLSLDRAILLY